VQVGVNGQNLTSEVGGR